MDNFPEETLNAGTSVDWGGYDFNIDDLEEPVTASRSAVAVGKGNKGKFGRLISWHH